MPAHLVPRVGGLAALQRDTSEPSVRKLLCRSIPPSPIANPGRAIPGNRRGSSRPSCRRSARQGVLARSWEWLGDQVEAAAEGETGAHRTIDLFGVKISHRVFHFVASGTLASMRKRVPAQTISIEFEPGLPTRHLPVSPPFLEPRPTQRYPEWSIGW